MALQIISYQNIKAALKLQPVIILFSSVSIFCKLASRQLPPLNLHNPFAFVVGCLTNWKFLVLLAMIFLMLGLYAFIWQKLIKHVRIAVIYANKSAYIFWTQIAAVFIFGETLSWCNLVGISIIFAGILIGNGELNCAE